MTVLLFWLLLASGTMPQPLQASPITGNVARTVPPSPTVTSRISGLVRPVNTATPLNRITEKAETSEEIIATLKKEIVSNFPKALFFVLLVLPGLIARRVFELKINAINAKFNDILCDIIIYSIINDGVWIPIIFCESSISNVILQRVVILVTIFICLFVSPVVIGYKWVTWREKLSDLGLMRSCYDKPWDYVFAKISEDKKHLAVIATLNDGRKIAGLYARPAFNSTAPSDEQIFLTSQFQVDQETGTFKQWSLGGYGILVDKKDILTLEFIEWSALEETIQNEASKPEPEPES